MDFKSVFEVEDFMRSLGRNMGEVYCRDMMVVVKGSRSPYLADFIDFCSVSGSVQLLLRIAPHEYRRIRFDKILEISII